MTPRYAILAACFAVLPAAAQDAMFRAEARLVEVYATVLDHHGRYIDSMERQHFEVREDGRPQQIVAFEANAAEFSCAVLLDTTGSMARALPMVKRGVLRLIDELRDGDAVAVYSFNNSLEQLQDFTTDRKQAKQAVLRTRPQGRTALFDAIAQVARDVSRRSGKKAIVVFTDGGDNASMLDLNSAMVRARKVGVPVYTVAQGDALASKPLLDQLRKMAELSGGRTFEAKKAADIEDCFQEICQDLKHTYMLAYRPPASDGGGKWRSIQVLVSDGKSFRVRAKEGYFPQ